MFLYSIFFEIYFKVLITVFDLIRMVNLMYAAMLSFGQQACYLSQCWNS